MRILRHGDGKIISAELNSLSAAACKEEKRGRFSSVKGAVGLNISEVKIRKTEVSERLKAVASVTFDQEFVLHDVKLIDGGGRLFLAMPSRKLPDGTYCDIAHPISPGLRKELEERVIRAYQEHQNERADCGGAK